MNSSRAHTQDIRPLHIVILNLMPLKITTETDLIRLLSNTPLQMDITFMKLKSHTPKNTPIEHMMAFYKDFDVIKDKKFDGMIITGAPVENYAFEEVNYWEEVTKYFHGPKPCNQYAIYMLGSTGRFILSLRHTKIFPAEKMFGVFKQHTLQPLLPIFRGFDDYFYMPQSRHTEIRKQDIEANRNCNSLQNQTKAELALSWRVEDVSFHNWTFGILTRYARQGIPSGHGQTGRC